MGLIKNTTCVFPDSILNPNAGYFHPKLTNSSVSSRNNICISLNPHAKIFDPITNIRNSIPLNESGKPFTPRANTFDVDLETYPFETYSLNVSKRDISVDHSNASICVNSSYFNENDVSNFDNMSILDTSPNVYDVSTPNISVLTATENTNVRTGLTEGKDSHIIHKPILTNFEEGFDSKLFFDPLTPEISEIER